MSPVNKNEIVLLQVRLPRELVKRVDHVAVELNTHRPGAVQYLLEKALQDEWLSHFPKGK